MPSQARCSGRFLTRAQLVILAAATAACSVSNPLAVQSSGRGLPADVAIALPVVPPEGGEAGRFTTALGKALAERSVRVAADGRYLADVALSVRDASGGATTSIAATNVNAVVWQAEPRRKRLLDGCRPQRMRATLVLFDRQTGAMAYRGEGEETACSFAPEDIEAAAAALVDDALARMAG